MFLGQIIKKQQWRPIVTSGCTMHSLGVKGESFMRRAITN